jgi:hypothetical protein
LAYKTALLIKLRIRNTIPSWGNRSQNAQIQSNAAAAQAFVAFVAGAEGQAILAKYGFLPA